MAEVKHNSGLTRDLNNLLNQIKVSVNKTKL